MHEDNPNPPPHPKSGLSLLRGGESEEFEEFEEFLK
jgi:hypothetical protein